MSVTRRIRKLEQHVVDKIAAGEVIQRPRNAVKELIENSLDAKATCIQVHVKYTNSDIQLIQVKDNGSGIEPADLDAVCERFSTSKLATFEDLSSVQTYGFRGEALASMSHVSHVTIVSRVRHSVVGYTMKYEAGQPVDKPKAAASNVGTTISVENLFYNVPMRKNALRNLSEEYKLIVELVGLYAIDNLDVSFVLRRNCGDPDVKTSGTGDLVSAIRDICGARMAKNLVPIAYSDNSKFKAKVNGWVGDLKSNLKSYTFILFINKRLVDCPTLRKSVEAIYKSNLAKGSCAFMYFSISIAPEQVDVNVHPTKNEVRFLYDDELAQEIAATVETKILDARSQIMERQDTTPKRPTITASPGSAKHPANLVRNCPHSQKVDEMFHRQGIRQNIGQNSYRRDVRLSSVLSLRQTVLDELSPRHKQLLADSNFVGFVKDDLSAFIQFQTFLIRISFIPICENLFYQLCLEDFQNFGVIEISPLSVSELAGIHLNELEVAESDPDEIANFLISKKDMLDDYFSLIIDDDGNLTGLPLIVDGYVPEMRKLPQLVCELALQVDWNEELSCFRTLGKVLSSFYSPILPAKECEQDQYLKNLECLIYPLIKKKLMPSKDLTGCFSFVSSVNSLYKVFHRC